MEKITLQGVRRIEYDSDKHLFVVTKMFSQPIYIDGFLDTVILSGNRHMTAIFTVNEMIKGKQAEPEKIPDAPIVPKDVEEPQPAVKGQAEVELAEFITEEKTDGVKKSALSEAFDALLPKKEVTEDEGKKEEGE